MEKFLTVAPTSTQREAAIETLTRSFADDTLTMDEFERRAEAVYKALTVVDLQALTADLDRTHSASLSGDVGDSASNSVPDTGRIRSFLGNIERGGADIRVPRLLKVSAFMGNVELDFSRAVFGEGVTEIRLKNRFGNIEITVPRGARVEMGCSAILASVDSSGVQHDTPTSGETIIRITGSAVFGNVEVKAAPDRILEQGESVRAIEPPPQ